MITLITCTALLLAISVLSFTVARTALMEQRISGNEYRSREVRQAAESGLNFGVAWLGENKPTWTPDGAGYEDATPGATPPSVTAGNTDTYAMAVAYRRDAASADTRKYVLVTSVATAASDATITATARRYVRTKSVLGFGQGKSPLVVDGCIDGVTGTPDIYPVPGGVAVESSQPMSCIDTGHLDIHDGGTVEAENFGVSAWDYVFDTDKATIKALSDAEEAAGVPLADRRYIWVTSSANWHDSVGSATQPVVLAFDFDAGCPKFNGNPTLYGILYYEHEAECDSQGWGGATVYGSVVFEGALSKFNANTSIHSIETQGVNLDEQLPVASAVPIPGTWSDF